MTKTTTTEDVIDWAEAFLHYEYDGYAGTVANLLKSDRPIPVEARHWLANVVTGEMKMGGQRGKSNSKLTFEEIKEFRDKLFKVWMNTEFVLIFIEDLADELGLEVIDLKQKMEKLRRDALRWAAQKYDVSENTIRSHIHIWKSISLAHAFAGREHKLDLEILPFGGDPFTAKNLILGHVRKLLAEPEISFERFSEQNALF